MTLFLVILLATICFIAWWIYDVQKTRRENRFYYCTSATRPAFPEEGLLIWENDTRKIMKFNGNIWVEEKRKK